MTVVSLPLPAAHHVRTTRLDDESSRRPLVSRLPAGEPALTAWVRRGEGLVGWGEAARLEVSGPDRFAEANAWWRDWCAAARVDDQVGVAGSGPVAFGSFAFADDATPSTSSTPSVPSVLVVPRVVLGRRGGHSWVTTVDGASAVAAGTSPPVSPGEISYAEGAISALGYQDAVRAAVERIAAGALDKVVLARDLLATAAEPVDPRWLLTRLSARYEGTWTYAVDGLIGATPEMLVRLQRGLVTSRVLAGTIRRSGDDQHDLALAASLARSSKDLEEHEYAVRSVAQALAPHCSSTNVPDSPFVLHLPNVMHLATDVTGVVADGSSSLTLAGALHPSAAVCGTPTPEAAALIERLEGGAGMRRGRYAGPVGWVGADGDGEWGIALRCGQVDADDPRRVRLFAGCGIVAGSDPAAELAETQAKLVPMRDALSTD